MRQHHCATPLNVFSGTILCLAISPAMIVLAGIALMLILADSGIAAKWGLMHGMVAAKAYLFPEMLREGPPALRILLLGFSILLLSRMLWSLKVWPSLGFLCLTRKCRAFAPDNSVLPDDLKQLWPGILSWYRSRWSPDRQLLPWALGLLNWGLTGAAPLFLAASLFSGEMAKRLIITGVGLLTAGTCALLLHWYHSRKYHAPAIRESAIAVLSAAGKGEDDWNRLLLFCGSRPRPYAGIWSVFVAVPFAWVGLPMGYTAETWALLVLAAATLAFSMQLAAMRFWMFSGESAPTLCCNLPLLEFAASLGENESMGMGMLRTILDCIPDSWLAKLKDVAAKMG